MTDLMALHQQYEFNVYPKRDIVIVRGKGARLWDESGREYIDCVGGQGVASVGHANEAVSRAVAEQAGKLVHCPGIFYNDTRALFLEKLAGVLPKNLNRTFLSNSGAESVEAAIKFARFTTKKTEFICSMRNFHGRTMGALSATYNPQYREDFEPLVPGFHFVPFNQFEKLAEKVNDQTAAVLLEPVQGEGGVNVGQKDYFKKVRAFCDEKGILLILDEVQTGFCRTGKWFGFQHFGIEPDILCLAKAAGGGVPIGMTACSEKIQPPSGKHGSTFGGNPLSCAAGIAALDFMIVNHLDKQARDKGRTMLEKLSALQSSLVREVRGLGLMIGIELKEKSKPYLLALMEKGVLALPAGPNVIRLLPPLVIETGDLDKVAAAIQEVLEQN